MSLSTFLHSFIWATFVSGDGRDFDMLYAFCLLLIASAMLFVKEAGVTTRRDSPFQGTWKVNPEYLESLI